MLSGIMDIVNIDNTLFMSDHPKSDVKVCRVLKIVINLKKKKSINC